MRLVLASGSPRRARLLADAGYVHDVDAADVDETPLADESAASLVRRLAVAKASRVATRHDGDVVLGADTVVVDDGAILGKPLGPDDARRMLSDLSSGAHIAMTGWSVVSPVGTRTGVVVTTVVFRELSAAEIDDYVDSGEPLDKAGAYAIQGGARGFVDRYVGSFRNVVGLPVDHIAPSLADAGIVPTGAVTWQSDAAPADWRS